MRILLTLAVCLAVSSCTSYGNMGLIGGVSATKLSDDMYKIYAKGNGFTSKDKIENFVLLKSADLAQEGGFKSFSFVQSSSGYQTSTIANSTSGTFSGNSFGNHYSGTYPFPC